MIKLAFFDFGIFMQLSIKIFMQIAVLLTAMVWSISACAGNIVINSPLAVHGHYLYAVAPGGLSIVRSRLSSPNAWEKLPAKPGFNVIDGLASNSDSLFVSIPSSGMIFRVSPNGGSATSIDLDQKIHAPAALSATDKYLYVADAKTTTIVRFSLSRNESKAPELLYRSATLNGPLLLAATANNEQKRDEIYIGSTAAGLLMRVDAPWNEGVGQIQLSVTRGRIPADSMIFGQTLNNLNLPTVRHSSNVAYMTSSDGSYPEIPPPISIDVVNGLVYLVATDGKAYVYGTPKTSPRALAIQPEHTTLTQVRVVGNKLAILDGTTAKVKLLPRVVPTEFVMKTRVALDGHQSSSECEASLYHYLAERRLLPKKIVNFEKNLTVTLQQAKSLNGSWNNTMSSVICDLNPGYCSTKKSHKKIKSQKNSGRLQIKSMKDGDKLQVPNLFVESRLGYVSTDLPATLSISDYLKKNVSSTFWQKEATPGIVCAKNPSFAETSKECEKQIMNEHGGTWVLPREDLIYLAAVPSEDVVEGRLSSSLRGLKKSCPSDGKESGLLIIPLEVRTLKPQSACDTVDANDSMDNPWTFVDKSYQHLRQVVNYPDSGLPWGEEFTPRIFVAENEASVDMWHPDLLSANNLPNIHTSGSGILTQFSPPQSAQNIPQFALRPFNINDDHGTSVFYLLEGQKRRGETSSFIGFAPKAEYYLLNSTSTNMSRDYDALKPQWQPSVDTSQPNIINLSLDSEIENDDGLAEFIQTNGNHLFIVSVPNMTKPDVICEKRKKHPAPACDGDLPNVLVVAATNNNGTEILRPNIDEVDRTWPCAEKGSAYGTANSSFVHIAAPGVGFHAAGRNNAYVEIAGTSFATASAVAIAASLVSQGVSDPKKIKRRIITTSDPFRLTEERNKLVGGLINVKNGT